MIFLRPSGAVFFFFIAVYLTLTKAMPRVNFGFDAESRPGEHIFLSYSRGDEGRVQGIASELHSKGLPIWTTVLSDSLIPEKLWEKETLEKVINSRIIVFFLSRKSLMQDNSSMLEEYQFSLNFKKSFFCVWLDNIGKIDYCSLTRDSYLLYKELIKRQHIEAMYMDSDKERADEIFHALCCMDSWCEWYTAQTPTIHNVKVGIKVRFGNYPQGKNGEIQPLVWRVLAVKKRKILLICEKLVGYVPYNNDYCNVTWETCTLRKWLNTDFFVKAFSNTQQEQIAMVINYNFSNDEYLTEGGNDTKDKVFVLNTSESSYYFRTNNDRIAVLTSYARKQKNGNVDLFLPTIYDEKIGWWLRSPGIESNYATFVTDYGLINQGGDAVDSNNVAVRPALWLNI